LAINELFPKGAKRFGLLFGPYTTSYIYNI
jgi:hypothetical protein